MKRKLLFVCMLLGSLSMWAQSTYPAKMYMIGDATEAGWSLNTQAMTTLSDGVYQWEGNLKTGELKFAKEEASYDFTTDFWGPTTANELLADGKILSTENLTEDKKFSVNEGTYTLTLDLTKNVLRVGNFYDSKSGHYIYFKNTNKAWTNVYLRIGRADHVYTKAFEAIEGTDWWKCETPDYENYTHFTITDNADATAPVTTYPDEANRLYEYQYDLTEDRWFILTQGPNANGNHNYWHNTSDLHEYTVYLVPEELDWQNDWTSANSVHLELNWTDIPTLNKEVKMSPIEEGPHIYKGTIKIPFTQIYGMNFKLYEEDLHIETYAIYYDAYVSADEWNGNLFSHAKNDDWNQKWFDYPAPEYTVEAGHTIYFDNTKTKWAQPYLRVGRAKAHGYSGNHVHSYPFTRVGTTDIWTLTTEEYTGAEAWTISNVYQSEDENIYTAEYALRETMQRIFYYKESIDKDICVKVTTDGTLDHDPWDVYYWGCEITDEKPIYTRDVMTNTYGTICLPYGSSNYTGATFYELVGKSAEGVYLGSVDNLEAGVPYVFEKSANQLVVIYEGEVVQAAKSKNGLIGTFADETKVAIGNYIIVNNEICKCEGEDACYVKANRAYINLEEVPNGAPVKMPGRKYVCMGVQGENQATQLSHIVDSTSSIYKTVENGQLIIVCGGVKYNAQGVKL